MDRRTFVRRLPFIGTLVSIPALPEKESLTPSQLYLARTEPIEPGIGQNVGLSIYLGQVKMFDLGRVGVTKDGILKLMR